MTDSTRRVLRTVFQGALALAAAAPMLVDASGVGDQVAGVGVFLAVCAVVTRFMASPLADRIVPKWLRKGA